MKKVYLEDGRYTLIYDVDESGNIINTERVKTKELQSAEKSGKETI